MKKITSFILSLVVVISACLFIPSNTMTAYAASQKWDIKASYEANAEFSVDTTQKSGNGTYSIKIKNNDYGVSRVEKTFKVKPNTKYRATVMAKCVNYKKSNQSDHDFTNFGAVLATAHRVPSGVGTTAKKWEKLTYYFESGDKKEYTLALYNTGCKGTAYFSDFRLEEVTNEWNFCVLYVNNIKAPVEQDGKKVTYSRTFCQEDKDYCTKTINTLYSYMNRLSDGKVDIKSIDFYECDETVDSLYVRPNGQCFVNCQNKAVKDRLNKIFSNAEKTSGKKYDHLIIVAPISNEISNGLMGINIGEQTSYNIPTCSIGIEHLEFRETLIATIAHEVCHTYERLSKNIDPENTVPFHAFYKTEEGKDYKYSELYNYGQYGLLGSGAWQSDYMRRATYDGKGIDENAYYLVREVVYANGKTVNTSTNKTSYKKTDVGNLTISEISDKTYTGKALKPTVTVKNGKTKLKKGTDYSVSYSCNTDIGIATVIIKGKGKYSGTVKQNFNIVPPKTTLKVTSSGSNYNLSWKASKGATGYEIYGSTDGKNYTLLNTIKADDKKTSLKTKIASEGKKYTFKIRAYTELYPTTIYSDYSSNK